MVTKETIKSSLEARWLMRIIVSLSAVYVILMLALVVFRTEFRTNGFLFFVVFMSLLFLPVIAIHVYQYVVLFRYVERYVIYEAELNHPRKAAFYKAGIYYTATFRTQKGRAVSKTTKPLWRNKQLLSKFIPLQEHSIDAVIAYNDVRDAILVLKEGKK